MLEKGGCGGADAHFSTYTFLTIVVTGSENQQPPSALPFVSPKVPLLHSPQQGACQLLANMVVARAERHTTCRILFDLSSNLTGTQKQLLVYQDNFFLVLRFCCFT